MLKTENRVILRTKKDKKDNDIRGKLISLLNKKEQTWFEICLLASDVYNNELYKGWRDEEGNLYEKVSDYAQKELHLEYRTFMWYVQMGNTIKRLNIKKEDIGDAEWTKFKEISKILDKVKKEEIPELFNIIKQKSFRETKRYVNDYKLRENPEIPKVYRITFKLLEEQYKVYNDALELAEKLYNITDKALAVESIMTFFLVNANKVKI